MAIAIGAILRCALGLLQLAGYALACVQAYEHMRVPGLVTDLIMYHVSPGHSHFTLAYTCTHVGPTVLLGTSSAAPNADSSQNAKHSSRSLTEELLTNYARHACARLCAQGRSQQQKVYPGPVLLVVSCALARDTINVSGGTASMRTHQGL